MAEKISLDPKFGNRNCNFDRTYFLEYAQSLWSLNPSGSVGIGSKVMNDSHALTLIGNSDINPLCSVSRKIFEMPSSTFICFPLI